MKKQVGEKKQETHTVLVRQK